MKALFEYFKDDLGQNSGRIRSAVELAEFQEDAVKKARKILARYDGVLIGDSVGLGKPGSAETLEDFAYHLRQKALIICPAVSGHVEGRAARCIHIRGDPFQEELGQADYERILLGC